VGSVDSVPCPGLSCAHSVILDCVILDSGVDARLWLMLAIVSGVVGVAGICCLPPGLGVHSPEPFDVLDGAVGVVGHFIDLALFSYCIFLFSSILILSWTSGFVGQFVFV
jgi:hypothetical protein